MNIQFSPPDISELEIAEIISALKSGWITTGPKTKLFEKKISEYCNTSKTVCLNSATAAMELTLRLLGVSDGDEVITSAYTYTASASVIYHIGAKIVLVDVAPDSFQMNYDKVFDAITEKTKVIIPVDIGGVMCDYDRIFELVEKKKALFRPNNDIQKTFGRIVVMADAAHSFGASYHGQKSGNVADFSCFSFHAVKNLTTAEGGAVTWKGRDGLNNDELYRQFMLYSLHGQSKDALSKMKLGSWEYDILYPAYKCNMTDITAAMGIVQLNRFDGLMTRRLDIIRMYDKALLPLGITRLDHSGADGDGNGHLYLVRIPGISEEKRNKIIIKMAEFGIATNVHFKPLPMHTAYKNLGFTISDYPESYKMFANEISIPVHTKLTNDEVEYIISCFKQILHNDRMSNTINNNDLIIERIWEKDKEKIQAVYDINKDCGERLFLEDGLLHWADPIPLNDIHKMSLEKELYLVSDVKTQKPIAFFCISHKPSMYFPIEDKAIYLDRIGVSPGIWRKGIGTYIIGAISDTAKSQNIRIIRSIVYEKSNAAVCFFAKNGFELCYKRSTKFFTVNCIQLNCE